MRFCSAKQKCRANLSALPRVVTYFISGFLPVPPRVGRPRLQSKGRGRGRFHARDEDRASCRGGVGMAPARSTIRTRARPIFFPASPRTGGGPTLARRGWAGPGLFDPSGTATRRQPRLRRVRGVLDFRPAVEPRVACHGLAGWPGPSTADGHVKTVNPCGAANCCSKRNSGATISGGKPRCAIAPRVDSRRSPHTLLKQEWTPIAVAHPPCAGTLSGRGSPILSHLPASRVDQYRYRHALGYFR